MPTPQLLSCLTSHRFCFGRSQELAGNASCCVGPCAKSVRVPILNDLRCNKQSWYANGISTWMSGRTQKNVDKTRDCFIIGLTMCTIPFSNPFSPQNTVLSVTSDGDRLRPVQVCHIATKFH